MFGAAGPEPVFLRDADRKQIEICRKFESQLRGEGLYMYVLAT